VFAFMENGVSSENLNARQLFDGSSAMIIVIVSLLGCSVLAPVFGATNSAYVLIDIVTVGVLLWRRRARAFAVTAHGVRDAAVGTLCITLGVLLQYAVRWCAGACATHLEHPDAPDILIAVVFAPLAETILFQGFAYDAARYWVHRPVAAFLIAAAAFVAIHGAVTIELVVAAGVLTALRVRTRSLAASALSHAAVNAWIFAATLLP
jgi:membrane protease YdiL (CAAX protease family)